MRRAMVLMLLAGTAVAAPERAEVMKKFPVISLPFDGVTKDTKFVSLTAEEIEALGFLTFAGTPEHLRGWKPPSSAAGEDDSKHVLRDTIPVLVEKLPETMVTEFVEEQRFRETTWEPTTSRATTTTGLFRDPKSTEELFVFGDQIFYRGNPSKPVQSLAFDGKAVRFANSKVPYTLTWDDTKRSIACTDPKGKAQSFQGVW